MDNCLSMGPSRGRSGKTPRGSHRCLGSWFLPPAPALFHTLIFPCHLPTTEGKHRSSVARAARLSQLKVVCAPLLYQVGARRAQGGCQFAPLLCGLFPPLAACSAKRDRPLQVDSRRQRRALVVSPSAFLKPRRSPSLSCDRVRLLPSRLFDWQWYGRHQALSSGKSALASLLLFPPPHSKNAAHRLFPHSMGATPPPTVTHLAIVLASPSPFNRLTAAPHQRKPTLFNLPCPAIAFTLSPSGRLTGSGIMGVAKPSQVGNRR